MEEEKCSGSDIGLGEAVSFETSKTLPILLPFVAGKQRGDPKNAGQAQGRRGAPLGASQKARRAGGKTRGKRVGSPLLPFPQSPSGAAKGAGAAAHTEADRNASPYLREPREAHRPHPEEHFAAERA